MKNGDILAKSEPCW